MTMLTQDVRPLGRIEGGGKAKAWLVNHNAEIALMQLRYALEDVTILAAEGSFKSGERSFNAGSFIFPAEGNPPDLGDRLGVAVKKLGLTALAAGEMPDVKTHELAVPRIAILHTWVFTQNEGWFRIAFEKSGIPYSYISVHDIRDTADLRSRYDVIIFPPVVFGQPQRLVNGIGGDDPIPWMKTDEYPHLGGPDSRDDIRGGIEIQGIANLHRFVKAGGLFIPIAANAALAMDYGMVESVAVIKPEELVMSGSVLKARVIDRRSPVTYGYDNTLGVYFSGAPVFETGMAAATGGLDLSALLEGGSQGRPSARDRRPREAGAASRRNSAICSTCFYPRTCRPCVYCCASSPRTSCSSAACWTEGRGSRTGRLWWTSRWVRATCCCSPSTPCGGTRPGGATCWYSTRP